MIATLATDEIVYPESDGEPMGESSVHVDCILGLYAAFAAYFADRPDVLVAGDLFWYPVKGDNTIKAAPDVMFVFGRTKVDRSSYLQWNEEGVTPQVVIEVLSPANNPANRAKLHEFYEKYGVEEYIEYDPVEYHLEVRIRRGKRLVPVEVRGSYTSARLGVRFEVNGTDPMRVIGADGEAFRDYQEWQALAREQFYQMLDERERAAEERQRAEEAREQAEEERQRASQFQVERDAERERANALAARLRELGIDPDSP